VLSTNGPFVDYTWLKKEAGPKAMTMLVAVVITENGSVELKLLWRRGQKTTDILKTIEIVEENGPIPILEHK